MNEHAQMVNALFKRNDFNEKAMPAMHAAIGISGEAGELLDSIKRLGRIIDLLITTM